MWCWRRKLVLVLLDHYGCLGMLLEGEHFARVAGPDWLGTSFDYNASTNLYQCGLQPDVLLPCDFEPCLQVIYFMQLVGILPSLQLLQEGSRTASSVSQLLLTHTEHVLTCSKSFSIGKPTEDL